MCNCKDVPVLLPSLLSTNKSSTRGRYLTTMVVHIGVLWIDFNSQWEVSFCLCSVLQLHVHAAPLNEGVRSQLSNQKMSWWKNNNISSLHNICNIYDSLKPWHWLLSYLQHGQGQALLKQSFQSINGRSHASAKLRPNNLTNLLQHKNVKKISKQLRSCCLAITFPR